MRHDAGEIERQVTELAACKPDDAHDAAGGVTAAVARQLIDTAVRSHSRVRLVTRLLPAPHLVRLRSRAAHLRRRGQRGDFGRVERLQLLDVSTRAAREVHDGRPCRGRPDQQSGPLGARGRPRPAGCRSIPTTEALRRVISEVATCLPDGVSMLHDPLFAALTPISADPDWQEFAPLELSRRYCRGKGL